MKKACFYIEICFEIWLQVNYLRKNEILEPNINSLRSWETILGDFVSGLFWVFCDFLSGFVHKKKPTKNHISLLLFFLLLESSHYIRKCSKGKHYQRLVMKIMENLSTREKIRFWFVRWELLPLGNINCKFYNFRKKINWGQVGNYFLKNNMLAFFQVPTSRKKRKIMHYTMDLIKRSNNCPTCLTWNSSYKPVLIF